MAQQIIRSRLPITGVHASPKSCPVQIVVVDRTPRVEPVPPQAVNQEPETPDHTEELVASLIENVNELERRRSQSFAELQMAAVQIGVLVASRMAYEWIHSDDFAVESLVNQALEHVDPNTPVTIRLNPTDKELLLKRFSDLPFEESLPGVEFVEDPSIGRGDCMVDAIDFGLVTTIEQRAEDLKTLLLQGIGDAQIDRRKHGVGAGAIRRFPDRRETA